MFLESITSKSGNKRVKKTVLEGKARVKKKLLISWGSPYQFHGLIIPLIPKLAEVFSVYVVFSDFNTPALLRARLEAMARQKQIEKYWLLPDFSGSFRLKDLLKHHAAVRHNLKTWKQLNFDVLLACDDLTTYQRYLSECAVSNECMHVCWIAGRTHLMIGKKRNETGLLKRGLVKIGEAGSLADVFKKGIRVSSRTIHRFKKQGIHFLDHILLPALLAGKVFPPGPYDHLTQTGPGNCDAMIFCDEATASAHKPFCKTDAIFMAGYPTQGLCRCRERENDKKTLLVFVGYGHEIGEDFLALYYRDLQTMLKGTGAQKIHLRPHPRSPKETPFGLSRYLQERGIDAQPVGCEKPIWEIVCDYEGVVGPISEALRDARTTCDYIPVVCLISISDPRYENPRVSFGNHTMIGWIEKDGSYDPAIFERRRAERPRRKSVPEILLELSSTNP